jgi:hypothetical protein
LEFIDELKEIISAAKSLRLYSSRRVRRAVGGGRDECSPPVLLIEYSAHKEYLLPLLILLLASFFHKQKAAPVSRSGF